MAQSHQLVTASTGTTPHLEPIDPAQRIKAVDMVRGFALFGVLLVNMYNFGASAPTWTDGIDQLAFSAQQFNQELILPEPTKRQDHRDLIVLCQRSIDIQLINVRQKSTVHNIEQPESDRLHFSGPGSDF